MCAVMATRDEATGLPIGEVLKRARTRRKVDIHTVEEQTKIRTKYLRALENEEWDVLPGRAYAKGFLRTYAQFLGLDGDALVDEYRRTVESAAGHADPPMASPSRCSSAAGDRARSRGATGPCRLWAVGALGGGRRGRCSWSWAMAVRRGQARDITTMASTMRTITGTGGSANRGGGSEQAGHAGAGHAGRHGGLPGDGRRSSR